MVSERFQRRITQLLDDADEAVGGRDWAQVRDCAEAVLRLDPENADAKAYLAAAERDRRPVVGETESRGTGDPANVGTSESVAQAPPPATPNSFVNGRYTVKRFLGEGGKKRVYLAHDTMLARVEAFALIKTDGLDAEGRERITREAQAMGRLGTHPHIVAVFDTGVEGPSPLPLGEGQGEGVHGSGEGTPYLVTELMAGGDIEALLEKAEGHRLPIEDAINLAVQITQGLEFAHAHGLAHRDLKPGNVWLTGPVSSFESKVSSGALAPKLETRNSERTAKIGDFGLAVSLDRSRLTRAPGPYCPRAAAAAASGRCSAPFGYQGQRRDGRCWRRTS